jgi:Domain of unknown function (DUF4062)
MGFFPVALEHLPSDLNEALDTVRLNVDQADIYVAIFAHRYGYVPTGHDISLPEMEYNRAVERGIPRLVFLMHDDHPVRPRDVERGPGAEKLERLKERVGREQVVSFFKSPEDLQALVLQSLFHLQKQLLIQGEPKPRTFSGETGFPPPPEPYIAHPYTLNQELVGRKAELGLLTDWVAHPDSEAYSARVFCLIALGGMGKSALAWKWFHDLAPQEMKPLAGRIWWSFYVTGPSSFENFVTSALAYVSRRTAEEVGRLPQGERERQLLTTLDREPYLLVLDGLERILLAYANPTDASGGPTKVSLLQTADPRAGGFLRRLTQIRAARVLFTSRLCPAELQTPTRGEAPGSHIHFLTGLPDADVLEVWRTLGLRGSPDFLLSLTRRVDNHPLLLQILAGVVASYRRAPGDLDRWLRENPAFDLNTFSEAQARLHILQVALGGLNEPGRSVLRGVAACQGPATYESLSASLVGPDRPLASDIDLDDVLNVLEQRGLIGWDRKANTYDIHPIVRAAASELSS